MNDRKPTLDISGERAKALDQAIDLLSSALRVEYESARDRRADVLRQRLQAPSRPALRERVDTVTRHR